MSVSPRPKTDRTWSLVAITLAAALAAYSTGDGAPWPAAALFGGLLGLVVLERRRRDPHDTDAGRVLEATGAGVLILDQTGTITQSNAAAKRILGWADLVGVPIAEVLPSFTPEFGGHEAPREFVAMSADNAVREVAVHADRLADADGRHVVILFDVSAVRIAEHQLMLQNNLLQSASTALFDARVTAEEDNRRKTQFLTYVSHEIRTPLNAILGFAEQLEEVDLPADERGEAVRIIRRNGEHLMSVLSDLLDLAKIEADHVAIRYGPCNLRQTIDDVRALFALSARARGVQIAIEEHTTLPATVSTDATRLRQILINLLGHALRCTPDQRSDDDGASVHIGIEVQATPPLVRIDVHNTGRGMPLAELERLFEPLDWAAASADHPQGGGLGLAISRRLARLLGGDLTAQSTAGAGTTLMLTLNPGTLEPESQWRRQVDVQPPAPKEEPPPFRARVLLVEDGPDNQRLISTILRRAGAEVTVAEDGARAVAAVAEATSDRRAFDLIIMDMHMPVMDGYEATSRLRAGGYTQPILALTANALAEARQRCLDVGCDEFASKPIDRRRLLATLRGLMERQPHRRDAVAAAAAQT